MTVPDDQYRPPERARAPVIAVDFDGVLHSYTSAWSGTMEILDPPVEGAQRWLSDVHAAGWTVIVHTCRLSVDEEHPLNDAEHSQDDRMVAIVGWMLKHSFQTQDIAALEWHTTPGKPHANVYLDDRGLRFEGSWPSTRMLEALI